MVEMLNARGIPIDRTSIRVKGKLPGGQHDEFDIIAHNGNTIVIIEVKTTLQSQHVQHFLNRISHVKTWVPEYAEKQIYGVIAWLTADSSVESMAISRGLFSIRATGNSASIQNHPAFVPKIW